MYNTSSILTTEKNEYGLKVKRRNYNKKKKKKIENAELLK